MPTPLRTSPSVSYTHLDVYKRQDRAEANVQALTEELGRQGLSPEQVQQQLLLALAQSRRQAAQAGQAGPSQAGQGPEGAAV